MFEIPDDRLPPGFRDTLERPPDPPATPRPAATTVLLRETGSAAEPGAGVECLLMRRHRRSGFVPGAWVFPGGRVDEADTDASLLERVRRLPTPLVPESGFWMAAIRELFEETGVLLARSSDDDGWVAGTENPAVEALRQDLLADRIGLLDVVETLDVVLDASAMAHAAHWVTPVVESRRYDTHFFVVVAPPGRRVTADPREMTEAAWLTPGTALDRFEAGRLPMVFPTVRTLETLRGHASLSGLLADLRATEVERILPRLVATERGVGIVVDDPGE